MNSPLGLKKQVISAAAVESEVNFSHARDFLSLSSEPLRKVSAPRCENEKCMEMHREREKLGERHLLKEIEIGRAGK